MLYSQHYNKDLWSLYTQFIPYIIRTQYWSRVKVKSFFLGVFCSFPFYTLTFKNHATCILLLSVRLSLSTPCKLFGKFWWNLVYRKITLCRRAYDKKSLVQLFFKELRPLDFAFSSNYTLSLQLLLNSLGDFDETWYKERSHYIDVHNMREALSIYF